jgi:hypothetical protein
MPRILLDDPAHSGASDQLLIGTVANDGTGDQPHVGGQKLKQWAADLNTMTAELYSLFNRTAAEIAVNVTPVNYGYLADPYVDPRRYSADPTGSIVSTSAVQTAINVALQANGCVWIGNNCNYLVGALTANLVNGQGLRIMGSSPGGSKLTQSGTPSALLTVTGPTPTGNPIDAPVLLENFTIVLNTNTCDGIAVLGLGRFVAQHVWMSNGGNRCFFLNSVVAACIEKCFLENALYGVYARTDGAGAPPNLVVLRDNTCGGNGIYAVDYDTGSELQMFSNDIEGNGTNATFTANPGLNANAGTLTSVWLLPSGAYTCAFPDGSTKSMNFTFNSTAVTWSGGNAAQSAAWISTPTGAIHIGPQINAFPSFGLAKVMLENNWLEGNKGGWSIQVDAPTAGQQTNISIRGGHTVAGPNGQAIQVSGATRLSVEDHLSATADTWNLTANNAVLQNCILTTLIDAGIITPTYINLSLSGGAQTNGRVTSFVGTLTTAGGATGTFIAIQQGKSVRLICPTLDGASTGNTATIMGLPAAITPSADRQLVAMLLDNNVQFVGGVTVGASGIITLTKPAGAFTASGNKGIQGGTIGPYDL